MYWYTLDYETGSNIRNIAFPDKRSFSQLYKALNSSKFIILEKCYYYAQGMNKHVSFSKWDSNIAQELILNTGKIIQVNRLCKELNDLTYRGKKYKHTHLYEIHIPFNLISLVDSKEKLVKITELREYLKTEYKLDVPPVRILDNVKLADFVVAFYYDGIEISTVKLKAGQGIEVIIAELKRIILKYYHRKSG